MRPPVSKTIVFIVVQSSVFNIYYFVLLYLQCVGIYLLKVFYHYVMLLLMLLLARSFCYVNACETLCKFSWCAYLASNKSTKSSSYVLSLGCFVPGNGLGFVHIIFQKIWCEIKNRVVLKLNLPTIFSNNVLYIVQQKYYEINP